MRTVAPTACTRTTSAATERPGGPGARESRSSCGRAKTAAGTVFPAAAGAGSSVHAPLPSATAGKMFTLPRKEQTKGFAGLA